MGRLRRVVKVWGNEDGGGGMERVQVAEMGGGSLHGSPCSHSCRVCRSVHSAPAVVELLLFARLE